MADTNEYYNYLIRLRDSGVTNMWGAGKYLQEEFGLDRHEASKILCDWIKSFDEK